MIAYLIFEKLPRLFAVIYKAFCESFIFGAFVRGWNALRKAFSGCALFRLLSEKKNEGEREGGSLLFRVIDGIGRGAVGLLRRVIGVLTFGSYSFSGTRILAKLRELYTFLDLEFFIGLCLCFFLLCPGELWHNVYGLVISLALLGIELIMLAADKRSYVSLRCAGTAFFAFILSTAVSVVIAGDRYDALRVLIFFGTSFIMALVIAIDATDKRKLKKILGFIYVAVILTALYAFYQRMVGVEANASLTDLTVNATMPGRVFSTFDNPNNYA